MTVCLTKILCHEAMLVVITWKWLKWYNRILLDFQYICVATVGEDKGTSHGKGYWSYLNNVIVTMLRKYLAKYADFAPHLFIIDGPIHGFDEGVDNHMPNSMRAGLYRYFMNHQDEGQLIIIENLDHIPHLDYEKHGTIVETFEKSDEPGKRYRFVLFYTNFCE